MLTVIVGRDASGNSSTRAPLARRYSVTPSTVAIFRGASAAGNAEAQNSKSRGVNRCMIASDRENGRRNRTEKDCGEKDTVYAAVRTGYRKQAEKTGGKFGATTASGRSMSIRCGPAAVR